MTGNVALSRLAVNNRNYGYFWLSQAVSGFGDQLTVIALAALVWQMTGSSLYTGLVVIVSTIPHAFFGFFAGPIADALGRKRTLIICDLGRAVAVGAIPVALVFHFPLWTIFVLVLIATLGAALFTPTKLALLPDLLPGASLARGNTFVQISDRTIEIAGKATAGVLFIVAGPAVFVVDALTFVFSAALLSRIELREVRNAPVSFRDVFLDAATGLRVISDIPVLSANLIFSLVAQVGVAVANTLTPVYLFRELSSRADAFGAAEAVLAAGMVVFALAVPSLIARTAKGHLVVIGFAIYGVALIGLWLARELNTAFVLFFLMGVANALFLIPNITIYQEHTPPDVRGRVFSTRYALLNLVWLPVMVISGAVAERTSAAELIGIAGAFTLLVAIAGAFVRSVRDVR